jgi:hypothetical protein
LLSGRYWWVLFTLSLAALGAVNFSFFADALFYRYDGTFILTMATAQNRFFVQYARGARRYWIPTATSLIPGFLLRGLLGNDPSFACLVFSMESSFRSCSSAGTSVQDA